MTSSENDSVGEAAELIGKQVLTLGKMVRSAPSTRRETVFTVVVEQLCLRFVCGVVSVCESGCGIAGR